MEPFTREERNELVKKANELLVENRKEYSSERNLQFEKLWDQYFEKLPIIPVSVCPFCKKIVYTSFDTYGIGGFWWNQSETTGLKTSACDHLYLMSGVLDINGVEKTELYVNKVGIDVGTAPFVTREEMDDNYKSSREAEFHKRMHIPKKNNPSLAVISRLDMEPGHIVYVICYFSNPRKKIGTFHNIWKSDTATFIDKKGVESWTVPCGEKDFDLLQWIQRKRVFWCDPGDNTKLSTKPPEECPFLGLKK